MQKITAAESLKMSILMLEQRQIAEKKLLKAQFSQTCESMNPFTFLQKVIIRMTSPSDFKDDLIQTVTGLLSGYLSRKLVVRSSRNPFLRIAGLFVQYSVTNFVANNSSSIKTIGHYFIDKFTVKKEDKS